MLDCECLSRRDHAIIAGGKHKDGNLHAGKVDPVPQGHEAPGRDLIVQIDPFDHLLIAAG